jgi:hypothetical protein
MAALQTPGDVNSVRFIDVPSLDQVVGVWEVTLRSTSDTLVVPGLENTGGVGSLTTNITVSASAIAEGDTTITLAGSAAALGVKAVFTTLHRIGMTNYTSIDEDPTVGGS